MKKSYSFKLQVAIGTVLVCWCLGFPDSATIDEIIAGSLTEATSFDLLGDMDGTVLKLELDMLVTVDQYLDLYDKRNTFNSHSHQFSRYKRKASRSLATRWPNTIIPYSMDSTDFSAQDKTEILMAIKEWEDNTCISFRRATRADLNFIHFEDGDGCSSYVGMRQGKQRISLADDCRIKGVIVHEIGHAVGFFHEQNRPDRDNHVIIKKENIQYPDQYNNFEKYSWSAISTYAVPYDYRSIMHYGGLAFSGNGKYTIVTKDKAYQNVIGNRKGLSFYDIKLANLMYSCSENCKSAVPCPNEGFLGKDCQCWCPGNPITKCSGTTVVTDRPGVKTTEKITLKPIIRTTTTPTMKTTGKPAVKTTRKPTPRPTRKTTPREKVKSTTRKPIKPIVIPTSCTDINRRCPRWAKSGYCHASDYVRTYCKLSCSRCGDGIKPTATCKDTRLFCSRWGARGFCTGLFTDFMSKSCPVTCGLCTAQIGKAKISIISLDTKIIMRKI